MNSLVTHPNFLYENFFQNYTIDTKIVHLNNGIVGPPSGTGYGEWTTFVSLTLPKAPVFFGLVSRYNSESKLSTYFGNAMIDTNNIIILCGTSSMNVGTSWIYSSLSVSNGYITEDIVSSDLTYNFRARYYRNTTSGSSSLIITGYMIILIFY